MTGQEGIFIYDTTLREGDQSMTGGVLTAADMIDIATKLDKFGVPFIEAPWPLPEEELEEEEEKLAWEKVMLFYQKVKEKEFADKVFVFGSTMEKDVEAKDSPRLKALIKTGLKNFAIFGKTSKRHVQEVLKTTLKENLRMIEESVKHLKRRGGLVFFDAEHFFDGWLEDRDYAAKVLLTAKNAGADAIILCDTNGGMLTWQISEIIQEALPELKDIGWGVHLHNDGDLALANTIFAINLGAKYAQVAVNGDSERVGMPKLTSLLPTLMLKMGIKCEGITKIKGLKALAEYVAEKHNDWLPPNQPFVGANAFTHKAGTHRAGAEIDPTLQEHIPPDLVGAKRRFPISGIAGPNGIMKGLKEEGLKLNEEDEAVKKFAKKVLQIVKKKDEHGYHLESAPASFAMLAFRMQDDYQWPFKLTYIEPKSILTCTIDGWIWEHSSSCLVEVNIPSEQKPIRVWNDGSDGPVHAIENAIKPTLAKIFPILNEIELVNYRVRILKYNGKKGTASKVRVSITGATPFGTADTVGVHENILLASAQALMDLFEWTIQRSVGKLR